jgi:YVTN family beta-propeller protein
MVTISGARRRTDLRVDLLLAATAVVFHSLFATTSARAYCAYVANSESTSVISVIDTSTNAVSSTIEGHCVSAGCDPAGLAVTPGGRFLYIANRGSRDGGTGNTVSVIDTATNTLASTVEVDSGPSGIAITPDGAFAYVTHEFSGTVAIIDTARALTDPSNAVVRTIPVGAEARAIVLSPDGGFAYLSACDAPCGPSTVFLGVIDTATNTLRSTVADLGVNAITPDGLFGYVANPFTNIVAVFDTAKALADPTNALVDTVAVGDVPIDVAIAPDGRLAYVPNCGEFCFTDEPSAASSVSVIDTNDNTTAATIPLPDTHGPRSVALTPDGAFAYVTNAGADSVSVLDTSKVLTDPSRAVVATIPVAGPRPAAIVIASVPGGCAGAGLPCIGDCGEDGDVGVDELIVMVNVALGHDDVGSCLAGDADGDGNIAIDEIISAVSHALGSC